MCYSDGTVSDRLRIVGWGIVFLALAAAAWGMVELLRIVPWILRGSMDPDIPLYFVIGRGILNGFTPYVDLFEWKPPGMFLLTALSLLITGDQRFLAVLTVLALFTVALLPFFSVRRSSRGQLWNVDRLMIVGTALCCGFLLALYLERFATGMDTETFGGLLGALYALSLLWQPRRSATGFLVRALLLLEAIGLKEYFFFILFAVALLLTRDLRDFTKKFLLPLLLAAVAGVVLLFLFGFLHPYLTVYIPALFQQRLAEDPLRPLPILAMDLYPLAFHMVEQFTESRVFPFLLCSLFLLLPALRSGDSAKPSGRRMLLYVATGITVGVFLLQLVPALMTLNSFIREGTALTFSRSFSWWLLLPLGACLLALLFLQWRGRTLSHVLRGFLALYLILYAIAGAGYGGNHYASALPVYMALVLLGLSFALKEDNRLFRTAFAVVAVLALLPYRTTADHWAILAQNAGRARQVHAEALQKLDGLLDACAINRYALLEHPLELAFSRHSPLGPIVTFELNWYLDPYHPIMVATDRHLREDSRLLLSGQSIIAPAVDAFVRANFTETPPACAQPFLPIGNYRVWFRK